MNLAAQLRRARKAKKLTQEDVAQRLGIDYSTISKWENGRSAPSMETLVQLAEMYERPVGFFLSDEDNEVSPDPDAELLELLAQAPEQEKERFRQYLRGERETMFDDTEQEFIHDARTLSAEDLMERYNLVVSGRLATKEEIEEMIAYLKFRWYTKK